MNVLTLGKLRSPIARALGLCTTDSRIADVVNEAQERLIYKGDWQGVYQKYRVCSNASCLAWPRQVEAIEAVAVCNTPGVVRNEWFEFLGTGYGLTDEDDYIGRQLKATGHSPTFNWVTGTDKYIRVYAMHSADAGKTIHLKYYDTNGQKVYSTIDGAHQEGEQLTLVAPPAYAITSSKVMPSGLYGVIKDVTQEPVILYEYDGSTNTKTLAHYEPTETHPIYKTTMISGMSHIGACDGSTDACESKWVTIMAALRHVPVVNDNDFLVLGNVAAFKLMALAIKEEEGRNYNERDRLEAGAMRELDFELGRNLGQGPVVVPRMEEPSIYGGGGIYSLVD